MKVGLFMDVLKELNKDYHSNYDRIGFTDDGYEVLIVTEEYKVSDVPHFHYRKKEFGKKMEFHTCIKIDKAEYYHHTGDENILSSEQKENLVKFLKSKCKSTICDWNHWERLINSWNHQNDYKIEVDENLPMPDYKKLK